MNIYRRRAAGNSRQNYNWISIHVGSSRGTPLVTQVCVPMGRSPLLKIRLRKFLWRCTRWHSQVRVWYNFLSLLSRRTCTAKVRIRVRPYESKYSRHRYLLYTRQFYLFFIRDREDIFSNTSCNLVNFFLVTRKEVEKLRIISGYNLYYLSYFWIQSVLSQLFLDTICINPVISGYYLY